MKKYINYLLIILILSAFAFFMYLLISSDLKERKENPYILRVGGNYWYIKSVDSVIGDKTYFTNKYNEVVSVKGPYVLEKR